MSTAPFPARCAAGADALAHDHALRIGWDHAERGVVPPPEHLNPASPVRQGWEAGRQAFGPRTLPADRYVRLWLQLRIEAWRRDEPFDAQLVGAALLRRITGSHCPVRRVRLTHADGGPDEATVVRVDRTAAFTLGNLVVLSRRAADAIGDIGLDGALERAQRIVDRRLDEIAGLDAAAWQRAAVLRSFGTALPHGRAACLPLRLLPPNRLRVLNPVQALQVLLSVQFSRAGHARRCATLAALMPTAEARHAFHALMHTLLARRLAAGRLSEPLDERWAIEDLWRDPLVQRRWLRLALRLSEADCDRACQMAAQRGLAGPTVRWLPLLAATEGWAPSVDGFAPGGPESAGIGAAVRPPNPDRLAAPAAAARYASAGPAAGWRTTIPAGRELSPEPG